MGAPTGLERPRTLAEAYALAHAASAGLVTTAVPEVIDLRDPAPGRAATVAAPSTRWPTIGFDDAPPSGPPRRDWRRTASNLVVAAGVVLVGVAAWGLTHQGPLPAVGTPPASSTTAPTTGTTSATAGTQPAVVAPTTSSAPSTTARPSTPTTRRPSATTAPPTTAAPTTAPTTEPPTTAPPTTAAPTTAPTTEPPTTSPPTTSPTTSPPTTEPPADPPGG